MIARDSIFVAGCVLLLSISACKQPVKQEEIPSDPKLAALKLPEGFQAERLFGPSETGEGSWVSMTFDNKGRLLASDQYGAIYRMEIPAIGDTSKKVVATPLRIPSLSGKKDSLKTGIDFGYAHGLLYAFNSLYVMVNHNPDSSFSKGSGLYRLKDTDNDDEFDSITLLKALDGEGEHGPHSIVLSPDGNALFVIAGNFTKMPSMNRYRTGPRAEIDNLIPLIRDPNGHDNVVNTHGGWIAKVDSSGTDWELYAAGFRNPFDLAFNDAGEMFTYDSDMEWDLGTPWYRPTRLCHVTSGSEFGWRPGTAKWDPGFADSRPAMLNVGQGSPTNLVYGAKAAFPEKYKKALFAFDWSFGIIYAVYPEAAGASYNAKGEEFLSGSPLPLTDGVFGPDGALYFLTGGRRLESDLYRVYYGDGKQAIANSSPTTLTPDQELRRKLEAYHVTKDTAALTEAFQYLNHNDPSIRYAARKILETRPTATWKNRWLNTGDQRTLIEGLIAYNRSISKADHLTVLGVLQKLPYSSLTPQDKLDLVRALEIGFSRQQMPGEAERKNFLVYLSPAFPSASDAQLNRQLSKILIYLRDETALATSVNILSEDGEDLKDDDKLLMNSADLIMRNPQYGMDIANTLAKLPPQKQMFYATVLSGAKTGWTDSLYKEYFSWFAKAFQFSGGHSYAGFINLARKNALERVPKTQFAFYNTLSGDSIAERPPIMQLASAVQPKGPGRDWSVQDAMRYVDSGMGNRNYETGKGLFVSSLCASCHMMKGEGGVAGPDLTQLGTRFTYQDMLEAIIEPSKTISDQYGATVFFLKEGGSVIGRLIEESDTEYTIAQNPFAPREYRKIKKSSVSRTRVSEVSPMLPGMINRLNAEEMKDLLAYLKTGGNATDSLYQSKK